MTGKLAVSTIVGNGGCGGRDRRQAERLVGTFLDELELGGDTPCKKDLDCLESGKACGGDVCSPQSKVCVLAVSGDPGACSADTDCWCRQQGATCSAGHCSFTTYSKAP